MANRPKGYGFSGEIKNKMDGKYSEENEMVVVEWIFSHLGKRPDGPGRENLHTFLKDGTVLCELMNSIQPGSVKSIHTSKMAFKQMENIAKFLEAATAFGVMKTDQFQTVDLYENQNMAQVLSCLYTISNHANKKGLKGGEIGVKIATENKRDLDEQKIREGRNIIGLQYGTNQGASQSGMTPYGLGRQMTQK